MKTLAAIHEFMLSRGGLRPKTQKEYRKQLTLFQHSFPDDLPSEPQPIQAWLNGLKRERGEPAPLTPETVHGRFRTLRALYKQIHLWHPDVPNPMTLVRPPRLLPKAMRTFADEELARLFWRPLLPRDRALLMLLVDIGPRADECASLIWDDVMPGFIVLKGKTGERKVPISDATERQLEALRSANGTGCHHVFLGRSGPLTYEGIYKLVRRLCCQAGITGRRASPHTFRHTFGTNYAAAEGCDPKVLQDIMGHRDFKTTLRYIQNNPRRMALNHQRCSPLKALDGIAQGNLFTAKPVKEAEEILAKKGSGP